MMSIFDWNEYLDFAVQLHSNRLASEAEKRSAISRAYYSAFGVAYTRFVAEGGVRVPNKGIHEVVWGHFLASTDHARVRIANEGDRAKKQRVRADYRDQYGDLGRQVDNVIRKARTVIALIGALPPVP
jgi:uncharacterized protein (UPF0332 family)